MGTPPIRDEEHARRKAAFDMVLSKGAHPPGLYAKRDGSEVSAIYAACAALGIKRPSIISWLTSVKGTKWEPDWKLYLGRRDAPAPTMPDAPNLGPAEERSALVRKMLGAENGATLEAIAARCHSTLAWTLDAIDELQRGGLAVKRYGDRYHVERAPGPAFAAEGNEPLEIMSDANNRFLLGAVGDNHAGSKHERLDVLEDLYTRFASRGITQVMHAGNWIDGEARFNRQDIVAYGLEGQARYLAQTYPRRPGISTHAIWGDDHEGWYAQREGIDVGRYVADVFAQEGRDDWHDLGFMEAHVRLVNANTGAAAILAVIHPGGGSAYATSYKPQKIIESMDGGEKPAVALLGHYHKLEIINVRNVWCVQCGATQDQTVFLRKKSIEVHVGGIRLDLEQDPETGAIIECNGMTRYFNRAYYMSAGRGNRRWSKHGPITAVPRSAGGV